jgi:hypothetical protein
MWVRNGIFKRIVPENPKESLMEMWRMQKLPKLYILKKRINWKKTFSLIWIWRERSEANRKSIKKSLKWDMKVEFRFQISKFQREMKTFPSIKKLSKVNQHRDGAPILSHMYWTHYCGKKLEKDLTTNMWSQNNLEKDPLIQKNEELENLYKITNC